MPQLTTKQRAMITKMSIERHSYKKIMKTFGCSKKTVARWKNELNLNCSFKNKKGSGRKKKINPIIRKKIIKEAKGKRKRSTRVVAQILKQKKLVNVSHTTVNTVLKEAGLFPYRIATKPKLTKKHIQQRRQWLTNVANEDWTKVVFSDEKMFYLERPPNRKNDIIWESDPTNIFPCEVSQYCSKLHVWAGICSKGKTNLAFIEGNLDANKYIKILEKELVTKMNHIYNCNEWIFMHDHATAHRCQKNTIMAPTKCS